MHPEAAEAIRIADKYLPREPMKRRMALALEIQDAIMRHAGSIAAEALAEGIRKSRGAH